MKNLQTRTVTFISISSLLSDLERDFCEAVWATIGNNVTWGDARHTLILARDVLADLDLDFEDGESGVTFLNRIKSLDADCYIDMET